MSAFELALWICGRSEFGEAFGARTEDRGVDQDHLHIASSKQRGRGFAVEALAEAAVVVEKFDDRLAGRVSAGSDLGIAFDQSFGDRSCRSCALVGLHALLVRLMLVEGVHDALGICYRKRVVSGNSVSVCVDLGGRRLIQKKP